MISNTLSHTNPTSYLGFTVTKGIAERATHPEPGTTQVRVDGDAFQSSSFLVQRDLRPNFSSLQVKDESSASETASLSRDDKGNATLNVADGDKSVAIKLGSAAAADGSFFSGNLGNLGGLDSVSVNADTGSPTQSIKLSHGDQSVEYHLSDGRITGQPPQSASASKHYLTLGPDNHMVWADGTPSSGTNAASYGALGI